MSGSNPRSASYVPEKDPYEILGVPFDASEADISRAYRKRALQLHPDTRNKKSQRTGRPPPSNRDDGDDKRNHKDDDDEAFHDLQRARDYLLEPEHRESRERYRSQRRSHEARKAADEVRQRQMSEGRKRMRHELRKREDLAAAASAGAAKATASATGDGGGNNRRMVEELEREGRKMREEYANRQSRREEEGEIMAQKAELERRQHQQDQLQDRQVRLKWSRKKMDAAGPVTERELAALLEGPFGEVERVEMLGSKGNSALATFRSSSSCGPCVRHYASSDSMRAHYVGRRKQREKGDDDEEKDDDDDDDNDDTFTPSSTNHRLDRDSETTQNWELRRAAEREAIMLQMLQEEHEQVDADARASTKAGRVDDKRRQNASGPYPPPLPTDGDLLGLENPLEQLERAEEILLTGIVPDDVIQRLKMAPKQ
jgi:DnaJ family protein C protein 17